MFIFLLNLCVHHSGAGMEEKRLESVGNSLCLWIFCYTQGRVRLFGRICR